LPLESLNVGDVVKILENITSEVIRKKDFLTELDSVGGDGDHGVNLERGFVKVRSQLLQLGTNPDVGAILSGVGATLLSTIGGATGSLYGAAFMKAGASCRRKIEIRAVDLSTIFQASLGAMQNLGGAKAGDKTMIDVMLPATEAVIKASGESSDLVYIFGKCALAAREGLESTKSMTAKKGRAMYLGDRTIGRYDVGAASLCLMIESCAKTVDELYKNSR
jgi:phosphoenolpyruvate---glycerone phosphotransferase subunit DhaL